MADEVEALRLRVGQLATTIQEERALRQRAEAELAAARAGMVGPVAVPIIPPMAPEQQQGQPPNPAGVPAKGPKIGVPDKFDGTRGAKAEVYVTQVGLYVLSNPQMFPDDRSQVIFSISYLTGQASTWAQPFTTRLFAGQPVTYMEFATAFQMMFYDTERRPRAEKALRALKQTKSVAHYIFQFNQHAADTGWEKSTLMSQYQQGLRKDVRLALVIARVQFKELTDLSNLALKIDNEINGTDPAYYESSPAPTTDPNAMDLSALRGHVSGKEKAEMMRAGLCFHCGERGHIARECPKKWKGKGKAAVRIAELEEEVRRLTPDIGTSGGAGRAEESKNGGARE